MADKKKSLADLGALTSEPVETPAAVEETTATAEAPEVEAPAEAAADVSEAPAPVSTQGPQIQAVLREQQLDKHGRAYATGPPQGRRCACLVEAGLRQDRHQRA
jgi:small subunit ribosomal protein S9